MKIRLIMLLVPLSYENHDGENLATERSLSKPEHLQFVSQFKVPLVLASSMSVHPWHYNCLV